MVSLPAQWTKANHVTKGKEVEIEPKGDQIIVKSTSEPAPKRLQVDVSNIDKFMLRFLAAIYKSGYDEVKLTFDAEGISIPFPQQDVYMHSVTTA